MPGPSIREMCVTKLVRIKDGLVAAAALAGLLVPATAWANPKDPSGVWATEDGRARVQVEPCGPARDHICGYVVWLKPLPNDNKIRVDSKNPDPTKTTRLVLGHQIMLGLKANADDRYEGEIYNNEDGKKYGVTIWLDSPTHLKVKGCLIAFLCSTQDWTKTADVLPGQLAGPAGTATGPRPDPEWASAVAVAPVGQSAPARRDARPRP
jgi:uncharacterized protein (DUF2147 family)